MSDEVSKENAEKLRELDKKFDRIVSLLEGDGEESPGLVRRIAFIERILFGRERQEEGLVYRVGVLWRWQTWVLCTMSAGLGFALRECVRLIWHV